MAISIKSCKSTEYTTMMLDPFLMRQTTNKHQCSLLVLLEMTEKL